MIPILYEDTEKEFTNNGIGRLSDAISCIVHERKNDSYELDMTYPVGGKYFKELQLGRIIYATHDNSKKPQPFDIVSVTSQSRGEVRVVAQHISRRLRGILTKLNHGWFTTGNTVSAFFDDLNDKTENGYIIGDCPFSFHTNITDAKDGYSPQESTFISVYDHLLDVQYGILSVEHGAGTSGEYEFDTFDVTLNKTRGANRGVKMRTGKNVQTLTVDMNNKNIVTGVLAFWHGNDSATGVKRTITINGDTASVLDYGDFGSEADILQSDVLLPYQKVATLDLSSKFSYPPTPEQIRQEAQRYLDQQKEFYTVDTASYSIDLVHNADNTKELQSSDLCDWVIVEDVNLRVQKTLQVTEVWYDTLRNRYTSMTVGVLPKTFKQLVHKENAPVNTKADNLQAQVKDLSKKTVVTQKSYPKGYDPAHPEKWKGNGVIVDDSGREMEEIAKINRHPVFVYKQKSSGGGGTSDGKVWFILRDRINLDYATTLKVYQYSNNTFTKKSCKVISLEIIPTYFYVLNPKENEQYGHTVNARILIELDIGMVLCNCMLTIKLRKCTNSDLNLWTYTSTIREITGMGEDKTRNNPLFVYERKQSSEGIPFDGLIILEGNTQEWSGVSQ